MGAFCAHCTCFVKAVGVALVAFVIAACVFGPGRQMNTKSFVYTPAPEFHGPFTLNSSLETAESLVEHEITGPESLVVNNGLIYTGLSDGRIVRIKNGKVEKIITKVGGSDCRTYRKPIPSKDKDSECGRPSGLRLEATGNLIVSDVIKGVYKVSVSTGNINVLVPSYTIIDGKRLLSASDVVVSSKGDVYFTEPTTRWSVSQWEMNTIENDPSGRILHFNRQTMKVRTLVEKLYFPNGLQLSANEDFLLVSQSSRYNILKYHLKGLKSGQVEVLVDNLPGRPDKIRPSGRGTYWVALASTRLPGEEVLVDRLLPCPISRYIIYSTITYALHLTDLLKLYLPFTITDVLHHELHSRFLNSLGDTTYGMVFEMKEDGTILRSLHSPRGRLTRISQVSEEDDVLYFGSHALDFIGKYKLYK